MTQGVRLTAWEQARIREGAERNWTNTQIAATLNRCVQNVREYRIQCGLPKYTKVSPAQRARVYDLLSPERSDGEIARMTGVSRTTVTELRRQRRVPSFLGHRGGRTGKMLMLQADHVRREPVDWRTDPRVTLYRAEKARTLSAKLAVLNTCKAQFEAQLANEAHPGRPRGKKTDKFCRIHIGKQWEESV